MSHENNPKSSIREKTGPFQSAMFAWPLLVILLIVLVVLVLLAAGISFMGVQALNVLGAVATGLGLCALLVSDLIPYWRREDNEKRAERENRPEKEEQDVHGELTRGFHWRRTTLFARISRRERENRRTFEAEQEREAAREAAARKAEQEREEARETAARDDFLLFGHVGVIFGAVLFAAAYILPTLEKDRETVDSGHSSIEGPESSDMPTRP